MLLAFDTVRTSLSSAAAVTLLIISGTSHAQVTPATPGRGPAEATSAAPPAAAAPAAPIAPTAGSAAPAQTIDAKQTGASAPVGSAIEPAAASSGTSLVSTGAPVAGASNLSEAGRTQAAPPHANAGAVASPAPPPFSSDPVPVQGRWNPTVYGFVSFSAIHDSTQSFSDSAAGTLIARPTTYAGRHDRTTFSPRGSRLGFRFTAPEYRGIKTSGLVEFDFYGNQPGIVYPAGTGSTEYAFFNAPAVRLRHAALRLDNPYVNILVGLYWNVFGWEMYYLGLSVDGLPAPGGAAAAARSPQVRLSHTFESDYVKFELAASVTRAAQRSNGVPDGQAGTRLIFPRWTGVGASGAVGRFATAASIGVSGVARRFQVPNFEAAPNTSQKATGWGASIDALVPIIGGTVKNSANAISVNGAYVTGTGVADIMVVPGGVGFQALPTPTGATSAPTYPQDIDNGLVTYSRGQLATIDWRGYSFGAQYHLPPSGRVWLAFNYFNVKSKNLASLGFDPAKVAPDEDWFSLSALLDLAPLPARFGAGYSRYKQKYVDGVEAKNDRVMFSGWFGF